MRKSIKIQFRNLLSDDRVRRLGFPMLLVFAFLIMRLPSLGRFVTVDESVWLRRSANFFYAVKHGNWEDTFLSSHPGVTTLWAGAVGFQVVFPEYQAVGSSEISDFNLRHLLLRNGHNPIEILAVGRAAVVALSALVYLALWPFMLKLFGTRTAVLGMALLAFDPFVIGHQRLLHVDGLLSTFMLLSLLAYFAYLKDKDRAALLISGIAAGLSWLTKTPGWFLIPSIFALTLWRWWKFREVNSGYRQYYFVSMLAWGVIALAVVILLFPAMWTMPLKLFTNMAAYALSSAGGQRSGPIFFNGTIYPHSDLGADSPLFYPLSFLWRSTPFTLIGLIAAIWLFYRAIRMKEKGKAQAIGGLLFFALLFVLGMELGVKKFDRYVLPAQLPLILVAGWGWAKIVSYFQDQRWRNWASSLILGGVIAFQFLSSLTVAPYYLNYYNPLLGNNDRVLDVMMVGWGEGLDQAAKYLNEQDNIASSEVAAWYSTSFNLLFPHDAADIPITLILPDNELEDLLAKDYLVIYIHQWQRQTPSNLLNELEKINPVHRVWIKGFEYARIYQPNELGR